MKKLFVFGVAIILSAVNCFSQQNKLTVRDITQELSVYPCQDRHEALVVIHCPEDFELSFKSNVDRELNVKCIKENGETVYNIILKTKEEGTSFKGRVLSIIAPSFARYYLPLDLKQKEKKEYIVSDPYSSLRGIFYVSQEKGNDFFVSGMYCQAKDQYYRAKRCPEYSEVENSIDGYVRLCDSMIVWTAIVDTAEAHKDYYRAKTYMEMMMNNNPECIALRERYYNIKAYYNARCNADMANGEHYMANRDFEKAKAAFQNAVAMRNPRMGEAELKLYEIEKKLERKTYQSRTLLYQYTMNRPIGVMFAECPPVGKGAGSYFSINLNKQCFDLLTQTNSLYESPELDYEVGVSAGWIVPIIESNMHVLLTPFSYTGGGYSSLPEKDNKGNVVTGGLHWYHAVSPEIGVIARFWKIALSYKFQYRYWIGRCDDLKDILGITRHAIGIGFLW